MSTEVGATRRRGKEGLTANGSSEDLFDGLKVKLLSRLVSWILQCFLLADCEAVKLPLPNLFFIALLARVSSLYYCVGCKIHQIRRSMLCFLQLYTKLFLIRHKSCCGQHFNFYSSIGV